MSTFLRFEAEADRIGMSRREAGLWIQKLKSKAMPSNDSRHLQDSEDIMAGFVDVAGNFPDAPEGTVTASNFVRLAVQHARESNR